MSSLCIYHSSLFSSGLHIDPFHFMCLFCGYYIIINTLFTCFSIILQLLTVLLWKEKDTSSKKVPVLTILYINTGCTFKKEHLGHDFLRDHWLQSCSGKTEQPPPRSLHANVFSMTWCESHATYVTVCGTGWCLCEQRWTCLNR